MPSLQDIQAAKEHHVPLLSRNELVAYVEGKPKNQYLVGDDWDAYITDDRVIIITRHQLGNRGSHAYTLFGQALSLTGEPPLNLAFKCFDHWDPKIMSPKKEAEVFLKIHVQITQESCLNGLPMIIVDRDKQPIAILPYILGTSLHLLYDNTVVQNELSPQVDSNEFLQSQNKLQAISELEFQFMRDLKYWRPTPEISQELRSLSAECLDGSPMQQGISLLLGKNPEFFSREQLLGLRAIAKKIELPEKQELILQQLSALLSAVFTHTSYELVDEIIREELFVYSGTACQTWQRFFFALEQIHGDLTAVRDRIITPLLEFREKNNPFSHPASTMFKTTIAQFHLAPQSDKQAFKAAHLPAISAYLSRRLELLKNLRILHENGLVFRDLKGENIIGGRFVDFGSVESTSRKRHSSSIIGTSPVSHSPKMSDAFARAKARLGTGEYTHTKEDDHFAMGKALQKAGLDTCLDAIKTLLPKLGALIQQAADDLLNLTSSHEEERSPAMERLVPTLEFLLRYIEFYSISDFHETQRGKDLISKLTECRQKGSELCKLVDSLPSLLNTSLETSDEYKADEELTIAAHFNGIPHPAFTYLVLSNLPIRFVAECITHVTRDAEEKPLSDDSAVLQLTKFFGEFDNPPTNPRKPCVLVPESLCQRFQRWHFLNLLCAELIKALLEQTITDAEALTIFASALGFINHRIQLLATPAAFQLVTTIYLHNLCERWSKTLTENKVTPQVTALEDFIRTRKLQDLAVFDTEILKTYRSKVENECGTELVPQCGPH